MELNVTQNKVPYRSEGHLFESIGAASKCYDGHL